MDNLYLQNSLLRLTTLEDNLMLQSEFSQPFQVVDVRSQQQHAEVSPFSTASTNNETMMMIKEETKALDTQVRVEATEKRLDTVELTLQSHSEDISHMKSQISEYKCQVDNLNKNAKVLERVDLDKAYKKSKQLGRLALLVLTPLILLWILFTLGVFETIA